MGQDSRKHGSEAIAMWIFGPLLCCFCCCFGLLACPDSWMKAFLDCYCCCGPSGTQERRVVPEADVSHLRLHLCKVHKWPPDDSYKTLSDWDADPGTTLEILDKNDRNITDLLIASIDFETGVIIYKHITDEQRQTFCPMSCYQAPREPLLEMVEEIPGQSL